MRRLIDIRGLALVALLIFTSISFAQEVRWSQYYVVMPTINPAATGAFGGDYRLIGNYRMSNYSGAISSFNTIYASYDQGIKKHKEDGYAKNTFFSAGLSVMNDKAGEGSLATTEIGGLLSFHLRMSELNFVSVGVKMAYGSRSVDYTGFRWASQFDGSDGTYDPTLPTDPMVEYEKVNYMPLSAGLMWNYSDPERLKLNAGISLGALNQPDVAFDPDTTENLPMEIAANLGADIYIPNSIVSLMPLILFQSRSYYRIVNLGLIAKWQLSFDSKSTHIKKTSLLYTGVFYRTNGDIILTTKIDLRRNLTLGLSYDMAVSADDISGRSAFEIALIYRGFFMEKSMIPTKADSEFFY